MAADVLHGQRPGRRPLDPDPPGRAARRRRRRPPGRTGGAAGASRRAAADRRDRGRRDGRRLTPARARRDGRRPLVIFTPVRPARPVRARDDRPRRGAQARRRHRLGLRRARHLRPLPGRAGRRRVPEARDHVGAGPPDAARRRSRPSYRDAQGPRRTTAGSAARPTSAATSSSTSRRRARSIARSSARASTSATSIIDPVVRLHYVEVEPPQLALADRRPRTGSRRRSRASGTSHDLEADLDVIRALQPALEAGEYARHRRGPRRAGRSPRVWPGLHDRALRRRDRRRLDDDRRPPRRTSPTARSSPATA